MAPHLHRPQNPLLSYRNFQGSGNGSPKQNTWNGSREIDMHPLPGCLLTSSSYFSSPNLRMSFITYSTLGHTLMKLTSDR